jgi:membrane protease YdiL (CAAX protease family)
LEDLARLAPATPVRGAASRSGSRAWRPVTDGLAVLLTVIAFVTFSYLVVGYRFLLEFFYPSIAMLNFLAIGFFMSMAADLHVLRAETVDINAMIAGFLAFGSIYGLNLITTAFFNYDIFGAGAVVTLSPFWVLMFYLSVGVAEEWLFTILMFGLMVKAGVQPILAAALKSAFFTGYHYYAAIQIFGQSIFKVYPYSLVLYVGSFIFAVAYYYTQHTSVPLTAHGFYNALVYAVQLGVITR